MDETYIRIKDQWYYLYCAVDKTGQTIDFLLTEQRDEHAAKRFLTKAIRRHGVPEKITIDGSAANEAAMITIRKCKYLKVLYLVLYLYLAANSVTCETG
jgi:putative transposase